MFTINVKQLQHKVKQKKQEVSSLYADGHEAVLNNVQKVKRLLESWQAMTIIVQTSTTEALSWSDQQ